MNKDMIEEEREENGEEEDGIIMVLEDYAKELDEDQSDLNDYFSDETDENLESRVLENIILDLIASSCTYWIYGDDDISVLPLTRGSRASGFLIQNLCKHDLQRLNISPLRF